MKTFKYISIAMLVLAFVSVPLQAQDCLCGIGIAINDFFLDGDAAVENAHVGDEIYYRISVFTSAINCPIENAEPSVTLPNGTIINLDDLLALPPGGSIVYNTKDYQNGVYVVAAGDVEGGLVIADAEVVGDCIPPGPSPAEAISSASAVVLSPAITIDKTVDCDDDGEFLDEDTGYIGDTGHWRIVVTNTGNTLLTNVVTTDTNGQSFGPTVLAPGQSVQYDYDTIVNVTTTNTATVVAEDELGGTVTATDDATNIILFPDTTIDILANDEDGPITVCEDEEVTLTICEQNTGDVDLTNPYVELYADLTLIGTFDETSAEFIGVDEADLGELDQGEIWCWDVDVVVDTTTTYSAIGYGYIDGLVVTWCLDPGNPPTNTFCDEGELDDVTVETQPCGGEGCTPGFWKNNARNWDASAWVSFSPGNSFETVFGVDIDYLRGKGQSKVYDPSLLDALNANGGGINALARHAVAALLNTSSSCINYSYSDVGALIADVHDAIMAGGVAIKALHSELAYYNEAGCPISQHQDGDCINGGS